jgi:putative transcriptional regulator
VLLLDHSDEGALGVVLNRPTSTGVDEILEPWHLQSTSAPPAVVFWGGPVGSNAIIGLGRATGKPGGMAYTGFETGVPGQEPSEASGQVPTEETGSGDAEPSGSDVAPGTNGEGEPGSEGPAIGTSWKEVLDGVGTVDLSLPAAAQAVEVDGVRLFAGYAGWGADQLEGELDEGAWFVLDPLPTDPFAPDPERLWHDVLKRQVGSLAMLSSYPPHPVVN